MSAAGRIHTLRGLVIQKW